MRLADDFAGIRARRDELAREHDRSLSASAEFSGAPLPGHPEAFTSGHADADLLHALFDDADKAAAHAKALGPVIPLPSFLWMVRGHGIELVRQPDSCWRGSVDGNLIGPYDNLPTAIGVACSLRDKFSR